MKLRLLWLALLCIMFCLPADARENASVRRALLVGCDAFLTHEETSPSARMNVERMARMLQSDARGYASIAREDGGVSGVEQLRMAAEAAFAGADENDVSVFYICTHGLYDRISLEPLLVLSDGSREESLTAVALKEILDQVPGRKIVDRKSVV